MFFISVKPTGETINFGNGERVSHVKDDIQSILIDPEHISTATYIKKYNEWALTMSCGTIISIDPESFKKIIDFKGKGT
jgi:hypothetical protein